MACLDDRQSPNETPNTLRIFTPLMQTMHDLKTVPCFPIDQGKGRSRNRKLSREDNPARTANIRLRSQQLHRMIDAFVYPQRGGRVVFGNDLYACQ